MRGQWTIPEHKRDKISVEAIDIVRLCLVSCPKSRISLNSLNEKFNKYFATDLRNLTKFSANENFQFSTPKNVHHKRKISKPKIPLFTDTVFVALVNVAFKDIFAFLYDKTNTHNLLCFLILSNIPH